MCTCWEKKRIPKMQKKENSDVLVYRDIPHKHNNILI